MRVLCMNMRRAKPRGMRNFCALLPVVLVACGGGSDGSSFDPQNGGDGGGGGDGGSAPVIPSSDGSTSSGGDAGVSLFYANDDRTLYQLDPSNPSMPMTTVGTFDCIPGQASVMTDIAV